jgi:hypothetical protein
MIYIYINNIKKIFYSYFHIGFYVRYHHAKVELQTQLVCGETKMTNCNWGSLHQLELFGGVNRVKILFRGLNKHSELLRGVKWTFPILLICHMNIMLPKLAKYNLLKLCH